MKRTLKKIEPLPESFRKEDDFRSPSERKGTFQMVLSSLKRPLSDNLESR